jgi:AraC-like DNA-binding protein
MQSAIAQGEVSGKRLRVAAFDDPQAYQAAIRPTQVAILVTAKGDFRAELSQLELGRLCLQRGRENLPRVANAAVRADRPPLFFLTAADQASTHHCGRHFTFGEIAFAGSIATNHHRTEGPCQWGSLSMTKEDLATASRALVNRDLTDPSAVEYFRPSYPVMSRLLKLHQAAGQLAENATHALTQRESMRALEQALVHAMVMCLAEATPVQMSGGTLRHTTIIARFEELLAANYDQPLYLAEICAATGASERTLRLSCMEHLGMGPVRYLWLRRMHLARHMLLSADPGTKTVTEIATGSGFWELGRFAVEYHALFGETPSASLRRPAEELQQSKNNTFAFADSKYVERSVH